MEIQVEFDRNEVTKEKQRHVILCQYETSRFNLTIYFQPVPPLEQGTCLRILLSSCYFILLRDNRHGNGLHAMPCCQGDLVIQDNGFLCTFRLLFQTQEHTLANA